MKLHTMRAWFGLSLILPVLVITGCNDGTDKISSIVNDPGKFSGHEVRIAGEVTKVYDLPLGITDVAAYRVTDGSGQIWVLSRAGAPRVGDKIGLKGTVREEGKIGALSVAGLIEEKDRAIR